VCSLCACLLFFVFSLISSPPVPVNLVLRKTRGAAAEEKSDSDDDVLLFLLNSSFIHALVIAVFTIISIQDEVGGASHTIISIQDEEEVAAPQSQQVPPSQADPFEEATRLDKAEWV
jgi:hypothetical protein